MNMKLLEPVTMIESEVTPEVWAKHVKDLERSNIVVDVSDILRLFVELQRKHHLNSTDDSTVLIMVGTLTKLHNDLLSGYLKPEQFVKIRGAIKEAYDLYPRISANYSQKEIMVYKEIKAPIITWLPIIICMVLVGAAAWLF